MVTPPSGLPHACGGVSVNNVLQSVIAESSPRLWGCFFLAPYGLAPLFVFPTPVGVFLLLHGRRQHPESLPHACGGVSGPCWPIFAVCMSSPRLWGCFCVLDGSTYKCRVFPTPVGVFPTMRLWSTSMPCLPHACGGVSNGHKIKLKHIRSSPRLWGCFPRRSI